MTEGLYEVMAKGARIPEASPNSSCKTWKLIQALIWARTGHAATEQFATTYKGEYSEIISTKEIKESDPIYRAWKEREEKNV